MELADMITAAEATKLSKRSRETIEAFIRNGRLARYEVPLGIPGKGKARFFLSRKQVEELLQPRPVDQG